MLAYAGAGAPTATGSGARPAPARSTSRPRASVASAGSTVVSYWADKSSTVHGWTVPATVDRPGRPASGAPVAAARAVTSAPSVGDTAWIVSSAGTWPGVDRDGRDLVGARP